MSLKLENTTEHTQGPIFKGVLESAYDGFTSDGVDALAFIVNCYNED